MIKICPVASFTKNKSPAAIVFFFVLKSDGDIHQITWKNYRRLKNNRSRRFIFYETGLRKHFTVAAKYQYLSLCTCRRRREDDAFAPLRQEVAVVMCMMCVMTDEHKQLCHKLMLPARAYTTVSIYEAYVSTSSNNLQAYTLVHDHAVATRHIQLLSSSNACLQYVRVRPS